MPDPCPKNPSKAHNDKSKMNSPFARLSRGPDFRVKGCIQQVPCTLLVDTGCTNTIVRKSLVQAAGLDHALVASTDDVRAANGSSMGLVMEGTIPLVIQRRTTLDMVRESRK